MSLVDGFKLSETQVIDIVVDQTEVTSISRAIASVIKEAEAYTAKYGVRDQLDAVKLKKDAIELLVERSVVGLTELTLHVSEDGVTEGNVISGKRIADLIFRFHYKEGAPRQ